MVKTQVQIPDHLYREAKRVAGEYEMSFAEVVRRGLEKVTVAYPPRRRNESWSPPKPRKLGWKGLSVAEFYRLLRNPVVVARPLSAEDAVEVTATYRNHPRWRIAGFPEGSAGLHEKLWRAVAKRDFPSRRIFDARLALVLLSFGVTEFA